MPVYTFTIFDDPSGSPGSTEAWGVNDMDQIVGSYLIDTGLHGFLLSGGTYITLDDPLATIGTAALGLNATGQIVGYYQNANGYHGFLYSGGIYTTIDDPANVQTRPTGINNNSQIVGT